MRRLFFALALLAPAVSTSARADGLLVPSDRSVPPLSLARQTIHVDIKGQVAETTVVQVFKNSTHRDLEADYYFPLPQGASMRKFTMWVNGKRQSAETLDAGEARSIYEGIVRRLQDPGLLEYMGRDLCRVRIYPIPRLGEQKIEVRFTAILPRTAGMVSYEYPLHAGHGSQGTIGSFAIDARIAADESLGAIYSPSHDVNVLRDGSREATIHFDRADFAPEKDFQLFFSPNPEADGVGFSLMSHGGTADERGYFLLLLTPRVDEANNHPIARDLVVVLDASGSMDGEKLRQAKGALKSALASLEASDRFALIRFATVVTPFRETLLEATPDNVTEARRWVDALRSDGGTDVASALEAALKLRRDSGKGRAFQVLLVTDGLPTIGRTNPAKILQATDEAASGARIFAFGVGDDVDAQLLDQLAETTRGSSIYVRPSEDLELKASALMAKIRNPVRTDLWLKLGKNVHLSELYPPRLPDLFSGEQLQIVGRYEGSGRVPLTLESRVGDRVLTETHAVEFRREPTGSDFIAPIWARRKVGYMLDQIRLNGESEELKNEVVQLAQSFGIATPYSSLLIVPDSVRRRGGRGRNQAQPRRRELWESGSVGFGGFGGGMGGGMGGVRRGMGGGMGGMGGMSAGSPAPGQPPAPTPNDPLHVNEPTTTDSSGQVARLHPSEGPRTGSLTTSRSGKSAIDLAQRLSSLKSGDRPEAAGGVRTVGGLRFHKIEDVWVDERFDRSPRTLRLKTMGEGYFRLLERHPELKDILALGQRLVWISPSGTALVIDKEGQAKVSDDTLDRLFTSGKAAR